MPRTTETKRPKRKISEAQVNIDLDKETVERLDEFCLKSGSKKKLVVELAIVRYLNAQEKRVGR